MPKHVFRLSRYGSCSHQGELVKETEKMVTYRTTPNQIRVGGTEGRMLKGHECVVVETDTPADVVKRWDEMWGAYRENVQEARKALSEIEKEQRDEAYKAAFGAQEA